jgi:hypothetical protein
MRTIIFMVLVISSCKCNVRVEQTSRPITVADPLVVKVNVPKVDAGEREFIVLDPH